MLNKNIKFEEKYVSEELQSTTFYFIAPKEILDNFATIGNFHIDEKTVGATISVEVPNNHIEARYAGVLISPTKEIDGELQDYDWRDTDLSYEEIEELLDMAYEAEHSFEPEMK